MTAVPLHSLQGHAEHEHGDRRHQGSTILTAGTSGGRYDITALIGDGGMGQVWQVTNTTLGRNVTIALA